MSSHLTLTQHVTKSLEAMIASDLKPGDRLPPERELAQKFDVSRTVIREAVHTLTARGQLEVRPRSGIIVSRPSQEVISQSIASFLRAGLPEMDYRKVMEVRFHLEVQIAGLAAERRNSTDLKQMQSILDDTVEANTLDEFVEVDLAFHRALAHATGNELYSLLLDSIDGIMRAIRALAFQQGETNASRALRYHRAIYEQVKAANPEGAREAMREHLFEAEDTIMRVMASRALNVSGDDNQ